MSINSSLLFLLAAASIALASSYNAINEVVSREYNNPDPASDPSNVFGYLPKVSYAVIAGSKSISLSTLSRFTV